MAARPAGSTVPSTSMPSRAGQLLTRGGLAMLLWMDKILHRFSDTSFCAPRAPFLTLAAKSWRPDLLQWSKSCTAQIVPATNVKQGVRGLMPQSFEVRMYRWCKISSIHRRGDPSWGPRKGRGAYSVGSIFRAPL